MKEHLLVVIKPDAMSKGLFGQVLTRFHQAALDIVAIKMTSVSQELAQEHYQHIKGKPFYQMTLDHILGKGYSEKRVLAVVYRGDNAIKICRDLVGATNPQEAAPSTIRGVLGKVTSKGVFENVVHASSDKKEAEREIKLWFQPDEIPAEIFPTKETTVSSARKKSWA
jgi:nucleoside-diphosphate kinase